MKSGPVSIRRLVKTLKHAARATGRRWASRFSVMRWVCSARWATAIRTWVAAHGSIAVLNGPNWLAFGKRSWGKRSPSFDQNTIHHRRVRVIHRDRHALGVAWERMTLTTEKDRARRWNGPGRDVSVLLLVTNRARLRSPFARPSHLRSHCEVNLGRFFLAQRV